MPSPLVSTYLSFAFTAGAPCGAQTLLRSTSTSSTRLGTRARFARGRAAFFACAGASASSPDRSADEDTADGPDFESYIQPDEFAELMPTTLLWREIPFEGLEAELAAVDEYVVEENLDETDSWPRFLRAAAYEHWGQPSLALAQYETVKSAKGLRLIPELHLRKAYNAFKIGDVEQANVLHDVAQAISMSAVGNQLHFSYWFEQNFADFKPRHNGPPFSAQRGICKYCSGLLTDARTSLAPAVIGRSGSSIDVVHSCLWFMAACARLAASPTESPSAVPDNDVKLVRSALESLDVNADLTQLTALFMGTVSLEEAEAAVKDGGDENAMVYATYLALYHDAFTSDSSKRDSWLDAALAAPRSSCTHDVDDFVYFAAKNRLSSPPVAKSPPVAEVVTDDE
jgi:hypothetical protein